MTSTRFSEDGAELVDEVDLVEERSSGFELDEEVDVARWRGVASSDGTDDPDRLGAAGLSLLRPAPFHPRRPGGRALQRRPRPPGRRVGVGTGPGAGAVLAGWPGAGGRPGSPRTWTWRSAAGTVARRISGPGASAALSPA